MRSSKTFLCTPTSSMCSVHGRGRTRTTKLCVPLWTLAHCVSQNGEQVIHYRVNCVTEHVICMNQAPIQDSSQKEKIMITIRNIDNDRDVTLIKLSKMGGVKPNDVSSM